MRQHLREETTPLAHTGDRPYRSLAGRSRRWGAVAVVAIALLGPRPAQVATAAAGVTVKPSLPSGQAVGATITWTAKATGLKNQVYRFSVGSTIVRDFSRKASFSWTPLEEGTYQIHVTAKDGFAATSSSAATSAFSIAPRAAGKNPVVSRLANPLVALYSAPACAAGSLVVQFRPAGSSGAWQSTAPRTCAGKSVNVIVAGMRPSTRYVMQAVVSNGATKTTTVQRSFTTGKPAAALKIPTFTVKQAPTARSDPKTPMIFHVLSPSNPTPPLANPIATDLQGRLLWYYDTLHSGLKAIWPVRILAGGTVVILGNDGYHKTGDDVLREVDLAGNTVRETNVDAVDAQLARRGQEPIYMFHHDALRLPNGDIAVLGATQRKLNGHDVMSDMAIVLDPNLQVAWSWDMFEHFTPPATFPKGAPTCLATGPALCGLPDPKSLDWSHGNALDWSTTDGNLLMSFRDLDMVIKIAYQNGHGNGHVLWRLGKGGDFTAKSSDPYPWFSGQHNATLVAPATLVVYDDGNTRCQNGKVKGCQTRGQEWKLDEQNHTATLVLNAKLGAFWLALGSAQGLPNGNVTFTGGFPGPAAETEFRLDGTKVYELDTPLPEYRAYRIGAMSF